MVEVLKELLQVDQVDAGAGAPPAGDQVKMGHGYDRRRLMGNLQKSVSSERVMIDLASVVTPRT
ncbi:hypothetical protein [Klebsiella pneumoniae]|uniref:hypothetical protein n=1 Tax=Klebsiella pneumoniae TaxID=573 RepID=UPI0032DB6C83